MGGDDDDDDGGGGGGGDNGDECFSVCRKHLKLPAL